MPVHDWTKVDAGIFHAFHLSWIATLQQTLNCRLPKSYYALAEQHVGESIPDVLTLQVADETGQIPTSNSENNGGVAVAQPKVGRRLVGEHIISKKGTPRTLAIRHVSGHRLVAMLEIVSPSNKDRRRHVNTFVNKGAAAVNTGIHLMIVDLFPPGPFDKHGLPALIWRAIVPRSKETAPPDHPLTIASMISMSPPQADFLNLRVGDELPDMALYLKPTLSIEVPLAVTYDEAFRGLPEYWRHVVVPVTSS